MPGDRVLLNAGQQVPADLRLIRSENMKVQEGITYRRVCTGGKGCAVCGFDRNTSR